MIKAVVVGAEGVIARLGQVHPQVMGSLEKSVRRLVMDLTRYVKGGKLSGQVLRNRTGTLRRSINPLVQVSEAGVEGSVGTNLSYGRVHEYGFQGAVSVKAHLRTVKQAFGRPLAAAVTQQVRAHSRQVNLPERSFLRSALKDMEAEIKQALAQAVAGGAGRW